MLDLVVIKPVLESFLPLNKLRKLICIVDNLMSEIVIGMVNSKK